MKKYWLAVIGDQDLNIARIAVGKDKEKKTDLRILYHARFPAESEGDIVAPLEANKVREWLKRQSVPLKELKIATSCLGLITRVISFPQMPNEDLEKLITDHIDQYFTLNVDNYLIDYRILKKYRSSNKVMMDVLIAAFPKEKMSRIWSLCKDIGFEPRVIDITADCLARVYSRFMPTMRIVRSPESADIRVPGDIAIVCLYRDKTEFILLENNVFFLYSDMEIDIHTIAQRFQASHERMMPVQEERKQQQRPGVLAAAAPEDEIKLELSSYVDDEVELYKEDDQGQESKNMPVYEKDYFSRVFKMNPASEGIKPLDDFLWNDTANIDKILEDTNKLEEVNLETRTLLLDSDLDATLKEQSDLLNQLIGLESKYLVDMDSPYDDLFDDETFLDLDNDNEIYDLFPDLDINKSRSLADSSINKFMEEMRTKAFPDLDFKIGFETTPTSHLPANKQEDIQEYKQAAIQIPKTDLAEDTFVLEDLFVPFDQLDEALPITKNHRELGITQQESDPTSDATSQDVSDWEDKSDYTGAIGFGTDQDELLYTQDSLLPEIDFFQQQEPLFMAKPTNIMESEHSQEEYEESNEENRHGENRHGENRDEENYYGENYHDENYHDKSHHQDQYLNVQYSQTSDSLGYPEPVEFQPEFFSESYIKADSSEVFTPTANESSQIPRADDNIVPEELTETEILSLEGTPAQAKSIFDPLDLNFAVFGLQKTEDSNVSDDPREVLENSLAPVLATLSELLGFFAARHYGHSVSAVYLTGDMADVPYIDEIFETNLGINTTVGFPNGWKPQFDKKDEPLSQSWKKYGCLYGLALRED